MANVVEEHFLARPTTSKVGTELKHHHHAGRQVSALGPTRMYILVGKMYIVMEFFTFLWGNFKFGWGKK